MFSWILRFLIIIFLFIAAAGLAEACPACWAGYGPGAERFNKPLADLRIMYEAQGKDALPQIKNVLKKSNDPLVQKRAIEYIAELEDTNTVPLLEDILYDLVKRVSFSTFGVESVPFQTRLAAAHTLANLGSIRMADKIWRRYDRIDFARKSEVPYVLNALGDPRLNERLSDIVNRCEDHQLMVGALDVLAIGGTEKALPFLRLKIDEWRNKQAETIIADSSFSPVEYSIWRIKAEQAIIKIEERCRNMIGASPPLE
jgi:hypothetical protein